MQIIIRNKTQFHIYHKEGHFDSGKYLSNPLSVEPFQQMGYCVSNKDNAAAGVSGGSAFTLKLSDEDSWDFAVVRVSSDVLLVLYHT